MISLGGQKVLITGGLGFIGSNLAHACATAGAHVTVYDCLDPKSGGNLYNVEGTASDVTIIRNDIRNFEGVCAALVGQDIVFHCAAYTSHPNSMKEPLIDIAVNCQGTINLLEAARRFNPSVKIVHVGTSTQIGHMVHEVIDELHPEFPVDIYSANKSAAEKYVLIYGHAYGVRTTVVRLSNVYGPRSNIISPDFGFMNFFIGLALQGHDLNVYGEGDQKRSVNYIDDAVAALLLAATHDEADGQVFFTGSPTYHTVAEIAAAIAATLGGRLQFVPWPTDREAIEIGDAVISTDKIKRVLNWQPRTSLTAGLSQTRDYFVPRLAKYIPASNRVGRQRVPAPRAGAAT